MVENGATVKISIHALHEESDNVLCLRAIDSVISIHALHEESDRVSQIR